MRNSREQSIMFKGEISSQAQGLKRKETLTRTGPEAAILDKEI
jgi:hypothetical protein